MGKERDWMIEMMIDNWDHCKEGPYSTLDKMFDNAISICIEGADKAYGEMQFKTALRYSWYSLQSARDFWRNNCDGFHKDLVKKFIETQIILLCPICPHWSEHMWEKLGFRKERNCYAVDAKFPVSGQVDFPAYLEMQYLQSL